MRSRALALCLCSVLICPTIALAQEATVTGVVTDDTKGALPGVTITATSLETGRVATAVTDERGEYRLRALPPGRYKLQADLSGFASTVVPDLELLVGQNRTVPFTMQVASLTETLTVTGESPLVDISSTQVAGNVDRRQMEELPLQGRNWMELAMQVKGITANAVDTTPGVRDRQFQLNLDGQEITQQVAGSGFGQPKFSREAIAEFQVVTNLFDITQGRSLGIQVQAISRSGTNNLDGSVYGYFRDDKLNAKDFIAGRVLPYENQQIGGGRRRSRHQGSRALLPLVRARERTQHDHHGAARSAWTELLVRHQARAEQLPRAWRLADAARRPRVGARVLLGLGQPIHAGVGHRAPLPGGGALTRKPSMSAPPGRASSATRCCKRYASATATSTGRISSPSPRSTTRPTMCSRR